MISIIILENGDDIGIVITSEKFAEIMIESEDIMDKIRDRYGL